MEDIKWAMMSMFVLLQVFDVYSTVTALDLGGIEVNKIMSWVMTKIGTVPALLLTKVAVVAILWTISVRDAESSTMAVILAGLNCLYSWVAVNNYRAILKMREGN